MILLLIAIHFILLQINILVKKSLKNIINIEKIIWKLKKIDIFSDNLKEDRLINFKAKDDYLFSILKNQKLYKLLEKDLSKNKFFKLKPNNKKNYSFLSQYDLIINCSISSSF